MRLVFRTIFFVVFSLIFISKPLVADASIATETAKNIGIFYANSTISLADKTGEKISGVKDFYTPLFVHTREDLKGIFDGAFMVSNTALNSVIGLGRGVLDTSAYQIQHTGENVGSVVASAGSVLDDVNNVLFTKTPEVISKADIAKVEVTIQAEATPDTSVSTKKTISVENFASAQNAIHFALPSAEDLGSKVLNVYQNIGNAFLDSVAHNTNETVSSWKGMIDKTRNVVAVVNSNINEATNALGNVGYIGTKNVLDGGIVIGNGVLKTSEKVITKTGDVVASAFVGTNNLLHNSKNVLLGSVTSLTGSLTQSKNNSVAGVGAIWDFIIDKISAPLVPLFFNSSNSDETSINVIDSKSGTVQNGVANNQNSIAVIKNSTGNNSVIERLVSKNSYFTIDNSAEINKLRAEMITLNTNTINYLTDRIALQGYHSVGGISNTINNIIQNGTGTSNAISIDASGGTTGFSFSGGPITSSGTFTLGGILNIANGGTGTSTLPIYGKVLIGNANGSYDLVATSTLGLGGSGGTVTSVDLSVPTGLTVSGGPVTTSGTFALGLQSGYTIPLLASTTEWNSAYSNRITSASSPLSIANNVISLSTGGDWAGTLDGQSGSYYTNANNLTNFGTPFYSYFHATTTDALAQGSTNKYYSSALFANDLTATTSLSHIQTLGGLSSFGISGATTTSTGNLNVAGNINFNGSFLQNGSPFVGSQWNTNGSDISYSAGNVGIGTSTPSAKLAITGSSSGDVFTAASSFNAPLFTIGNTGVVKVAAVNSAAGSIQGLDNSSSGIGISSGNFNFGNYAYIVGTQNTFRVNSNLAFGFSTDIFNNTNDVAVSRISSGVLGIGTGLAGNSSGTLLAGNIGIGTTTPWKNLSVVGDMVLTGGFYDSLSSSGTNGMVLQSTGSATKWVATSTLGLSSTLTGTTGQFAYFSGTNNAVGTSSIFISTVGNVGIGTTNPSGKLDVQGGYTYLNGLRISGSDNTNTIYQPSGAIGITAGGGGQGLFVTASGASYANGAFGAGTASPGYALHVRPLATDKYGLYIDGLSAQTANLAQFNVSGVQKAYIDKDGGAYFGGNVSVGTTTPWGQLSVNPNGITGPSFVVGSSTATNFIVTNGGNVGVGTANPTQMFDVLVPTNADKGFTFRSGSGTILTGTNGSSGNYGLTLANGLVAIDNFYGLRMTSGSLPIQGLDSSATIARDLSIRGKTLEFKTGNSGSAFPNTAMTIDVNGNVGVGSTTPWGQFSVNPNGITGPSFVVGSSTATQFVVSNGGNVGINTAAPSSTYKLDINGGARITTGNSLIVDTVSPNAGANLTLIAGSSNRAYFGGSGVFGGQLTAATGELGISGTTVLRWTNDATSYGTADIGFSRGASGKLYLGNGTASDYTGTLIAGNIGIGTTTPWAQLSVNSNGITGPSFAIGSSTATSFIVTNGGYVGIGTSAPTRNFVVTNNIAGAGTISISPGDPTLSTAIGATVMRTNSTGNFDFDNPKTINFNFNTGDNTGATRKFTINYGSAQTNALTVVGGVDQANAGFVGVGSTTPWGQFSINPNGITGPSFAIGSSTATQFIVTNGGYVGIGTSTPNNTLSVVGAGYFTTGLSVGGSNATTTGTRVSMTPGTFSLYNSSDTSARLSLSPGGSGSLPNGVPGIVVNSQSGAGSANLYGAAIAQNGTQNTLSFYVSNGTTLMTERARFDSNGNFGIGTTSPLARLDVVGINNGTSPLFQVSSLASFATTTRFLIDSSGNIGIGTSTPAFPLDVYSTVNSTQTYGFLNASGVVGTAGPGSNGYSIRAQGRIMAPEFNAVSDARLKNVNFELTSDVALGALLKLQPVSFNWKNEPNGQPILGFLAQDVETVIPNAVSKIATENFADQRMLDYNQITAVMVGAVKEIKIELDALSQKISSMMPWFVDGKFKVQSDVCVDDVCVTKQQFKQMLLNSGASHTTVSVPNPNNTSTTTESTSTTTESTSTTTPPNEDVNTPVETPSEPIPEPASADAAPAPETITP
ncbi:MAG: hypothetical protein JWP09_282 [Candidatus Taylorbacteria bacterium]|nr:hypothetical protein [Candidatus Taylorbacteria bacterium]